MTTTRSVALIAALAVVGLTIAPLASGAVASAFTAAETGQSETETTNASVGTLMQASAADTSNTVESGMFEAAYENADNDSREAVVRDRTAELEERLATLEAERDALAEQRGNLSRGEYRSRMAKLTVEIASLERSIERTEHRAAEVGVGESRLAALRENAAAIRRNASERAGPGTATVARGLTGDDSPGAGAGPPADSGPPHDTDDPGNEKTGRSGTPPADRSPSDESPNDGNDGQQPSS